jgi:L-asparaginase/Glu-tRNA(Gln) amidotransferase subunit D
MTTWFIRVLSNYYKLKIQSGGKVQMPQSSSKPSIAVIMTGGTIGSVLTDNATRADEAGNALLQSRMEILAKNRIFDFKFDQLLAKDSGDFSMREWHMIAQKVDEIRASGCTRFLITHGTDTLPFTATLLQLLYGKKNITIALTAAFYPLEDKRCDAMDNLTAAMALLTQPEQRYGVYIPFRGMGQDVTLHHAMNIKQMAADEDAFHSLYDNPAGVYQQGKGFSWNEHKRRLLETDYALPAAEALSKAAKRVFFLQAYPGMSLLPYHALAEKEDILLVIRNYHSGTACAIDGPGRVMEFIKKFPKSLVAFAPFPAPLINKPYESTIALINHGAHIYRDLSVHKLYVLGVLGMANGLAPRAALDPALPWLLKSVSE